METEEELAVFRALDRATTREARLRNMGREVLFRQRALRRALTARQWQDIVALSDLVNRRHFEILILAIRIALRQGRRAQARKR
jgi:hypothetical protein